MANINEITINDNYGNTGIGTGAVEFGKIVGMFIATKRKSITNSQVVTSLIDGLTTLVTDANPADRIFPVYNLEGLTDGSEDVTIQTMPYGGKYPVKDGDYDWSFQFVKGGVSLTGALRKFNGREVFAYFIDDSGKLIGYKDGTTLSMIPLKMFWADKWKANDGSNRSGHMVKVVFEPKYINDILGFAESDGDIQTEVEGIQSALLSVHTALNSSRVVKIAVKALFGNVNMLPVFGSDIAGSTSNFVAEAVSTGLSIAISSAVLDTDKEFITLTFSSTNYPAASGTFTLRLASVSQLGVNVESDTLTLTAS